MSQLIKFISLSICIFFYACEPFSLTILSKPTINTLAADSISETTAIVGGNIIEKGNSIIISQGICWGLSENPTFSDNVSIDHSGLSTFRCQLSNLKSGTTYYARAFASNSEGTSYGAQISFTTIQTIQPTQNTVTDVDGNIYKTVTIGNQTWMAENLRVTHYQNGDVIPNLTDVVQWTNAGSTPGQCTYRNSTEKDTIVKYGRFYNGFTVFDSRKVAPIGWHIPSKAEWDTLSAYLTRNPGSSGSAGKALASVSSWYEDTTWPLAIGNNLSINNCTGFSAYAINSVSYYGDFGPYGIAAVWWTSSETSSKSAWYKMIYYRNEYLSEYDANKNGGCNIRCIKD